MLVSAIAVAVSNGSEKNKLKAAWHSKLMLKDFIQLTASEKPLPWFGVTLLFSGNGAFAICGILRHLHQSGTVSSSSVIGTKVMYAHLLLNC